MLSISIRKNIEVTIANQAILIRGLKRPAVNTSQLTVGRRTGALGMKVGMLAIFDKWGERHAVTVVQIDKCKVIQKKTVESEGYNALQLGIGLAKEKRVKKVLLGHFRKAGVEPKVINIFLFIFLLFI